MIEGHLEESVCANAQRLGYTFRIEQMDDGQWSASFTAPADKPDMRPLRSEATGPDRASALRVLAYVIDNPGVKVPRRQLSLRSRSKSGLSDDS
jgi:hypothetical protein